jgi:hypothetical protein
MRAGLGRYLVVVWTLLMIGAAVAWLVLERESLDSMAGFVVAAVCLIVVGSILAMKVPANAVGQLAVIAGSALVIYVFGNGYALASLDTDPNGLPAAHFFGWMGAWAGALFPIGVSTLILVFPTGKPVGRWRVALIVPVTVGVLVALGATLMWSLPLSTLTDYDLLSLAPGYGLVDVSFVLGYVFSLPATISVIVRFRTAGFVERQQIKWLLAATGVLAVTYFIASASPDDTMAWWLVALAMAAIPFAILLAVLRYRLYEIDRIVSRTVSYTVVVVVLAAVYVGAVTWLTTLLPDQSELVVAATTLAVATLFNPVRRRVQGWVDRRFNRSRYDTQRVMDDFAGSLRDQVDAEAVMDGWVGVVNQTMQPTSAAVWVKTPFRNDSGTIAG